MSDLNGWLKKRRRIHELGNDVLLRNSYELERETDLGIRDAKAVEDGFNTLPALLTAIENVLKLHQPEYLIRDGEWRPANCAVCEPWTWPCATVRAIEGAIEGEH